MRREPEGETNLIGHKLTGYLLVKPVAFKYAQHFFLSLSAPCHLLILILVHFIAHSSIHIRFMTEFT